jgi:2-polyprenyl-3-methyl-5-hydroxy-6-metoxy-1,4-benzoquinol methylase
MNCYLCNSSSFIRREGIVRDAPELEIQECTGCGVVTFSSAEHIVDDFYENSGMHAENLLPINEWLQLLEQDDNRRVMYLDTKLVNKDVLDFGCGPGSFILKARSKAKSFYGIELESRLESHYIENHLSVVKQIDQLPPEKRFDLITSFHVVEHLKDPAEMLKQLSTKLKTDGHIVIEIPSSSDILLTVYKNKPFSEFTYWSCHLFHFNASNLKLLAQKAGLKLDYVDHVQRYPLSNHLFWLANGNPGGHEKWKFLDSDELSCAYESKLASLGLTDTLIASFSL